jgi:hypothetical protein
MYKILFQQCIEYISPVTNNAQKPYNGKTYIENILVGAETLQRARKT